MIGVLIFAVGLAGFAMWGGMFDQRGMAVANISAGQLAFDAAQAVAANGGRV